jgi:hypothetical protein
MTDAERDLLEHILWALTYEMTDRQAAVAALLAAKNRYYAERDMQDSPDRLGEL